MQGTDERGGAPRLRDVVTSTSRRAELVASGEWTEQTLAEQVVRHAAATPASVAVLDLVGSRQHTYAELDADSNRVANRLRQLGVQSGDVVSVQLPNWYETVAVDVGVLKIGAVLNPLLPVYRSHELLNVVRTARTRLLITPRVYRGFDYEAMAAQIAAAEPGLATVTVEDPFQDRAAFGRWLADSPCSAPSAPLHAADVSELIFSSGTEAQPKAIMHTEQTTNSGVRKIFRAIGMSDLDRVWMPSPIGHSTGFNYGLRLALLHGLPLALQDRWDTADAIRIIEQVGATYTVAATTFLTDLLDALGTTPADVSTMRLFCCGGAPVPAVLVEQASVVGMNVLRLYGSTEVLIGSWCRPSDPPGKRLHTEGPPLPGVELQIRVGQQPVTADTPGELYVRSSTTSVGFFADPERTAATFNADGWVKTGDIGKIDDLGYFTMLGRSKEILIRGGLNVAPAEVEELILSMQGVKEVAVIALPHERLGEIGCACIVPTDGFAPTLADVVAHLREQGLATFKLPEAVHLLDELPKTPTGKIQKFEIVRHLREEPR